MVRPKRLYKDGDRYYYIVKGKRKYIKVPANMSQKQIVKINIRNVAPEGKRIKRRKKRVQVKYEKPVVKGMEKVRSELPIYFFQPKKNIPNYGELSTGTKPKIEELKGGDDLKGINKLIENSKQETIKSVSGMLQDATIERRQLLNTIFEGVKQLKNLKPTEKITPLELPKPEAEEEEETKTVITDEGIEKSFLEVKMEDIPKPIVYESSDGKPYFPETEGEIDTEPRPRLLLQKKREEQIKTEAEQRRITKYFPGILAELINRPLTKEEKSKLNTKNYDRRTVENQRQEIVNEIKLNNPRVQTIPINTDKSFKKAIKDEYIRLKKTEGKGASLKDGLYNDEIENILKEQIQDYVPVIASDKVTDMLKFVKPRMKRFGFIINTNPSTSDGSGRDGYREGHWRACYFNNEDDFTSAEYFDPLAEGNPEPALLDTMKKIAKKMNPENYFLFKVNNLKRQPDGTPTCGWHAIKFLDDRFQGIGWDDATGYNHYMETHRPEDSVDGEKQVKNYFEKYKSYI